LESTRLLSDEQTFLFVFPPLCTLWLYIRPRATIFSSCLRGYPSRSSNNPDLNTSCFRRLL
uniref:Ovule protein n=1 Tax=Haemonchus placei TaxID=6290 RepID=A0A0N4WXS9_HAEPC